MGYNTNFSLNWEARGRNDTRCECGVIFVGAFCINCGSSVSLDDRIGNWLERELDGYGVDRFGDSTGGCKWYNYNKMMLELSKAFDDVLFTLGGNGEMSDDIWQSYYYNGKMQHVAAEIVFAEFDEEKLQ